MGIKVLFLDPNTYGMNIVPPSIALFSAILKKEVHQVQIFDTTYYQIDYGIDSDGSQVDKLSVVPFDMGERGIRLKATIWKEDLGYIKPETITKCLTTDETSLNMPEYPRHEIAEIRKCFNLCVKFPKNRWKEIERAKKNDKEGNKIFDYLKEEFLEKYMPAPNADPHGNDEPIVDQSRII